MLLDTLLSSAPVGLAFFDRELRFVRVNQTLAQINGRPAEEHIGRTLQEFDEGFSVRAATGSPLRWLVSGPPRDAAWRVPPVCGVSSARFGAGPAKARYLPLK